MLLPSDGELTVTDTPIADEAMKACGELATGPLAEVIPIRIERSPAEAIKFLAAWNMDNGYGPVGIERVDEQGRIYTMNCGKRHYRS